MSRKIELLAPAGSPEALKAAVYGGADAVYLGWGAFNARRGARNFSEEEFAQAAAWCHVRGVRVFLTLNILLSDRELPEALETARTASRLGVDAVLVQDWGLFDLLRRALHTESFRREYRAICLGCPMPERGTVDAPIGRDESSVVARRVRADGAPAVSHYAVLAKGEGLSLLALRPETGRTHQLRVHMASLGCPLAGDWLYGTEDPGLIPRPALHSYKLTLAHPVTGKLVEVSAPLPEDMGRLLQERFPAGTGA